MEEIYRAPADDVTIRNWTKAFVEALPDEAKPSCVKGVINGRTQVTHLFRYNGHHLTFRLNSDMTIQPKSRALHYLEWIRRSDILEMVKASRAAMTCEVLVEKAAIACAWQRIDGATFTNAMREIMACGEITVGKKRQDCFPSRSSIELTPALTIRKRNDGGYAARLSDNRFHITDITYTPQIDMLLPRPVMLSIEGKPLDEVVNCDAIRGLGLVVAAVMGNENGMTRPRTVFRVKSDQIPLGEASIAIDQMRRNHQHLVQAATQTNEE